MSTAEAVRTMIAGSARSDVGVVVSLAEATFIDSAVIGALHRGQLLLGQQNRVLVLHVEDSSPVYRAIEIANVGATITCTALLATAIALASARRADLGHTDPPVPVCPRQLSE